MFSLKFLFHGGFMSLRVASVLCFVILNSVELTAQFPVLPTPDHDFGAVKQGERLMHTFTIRNTTTSLMRIDRIDLSVQGITTRFKPDIPPGADAQVTLEWDTVRANGDAEAIAMVHLNDKAQTGIALQLRAMVKPPIEFSPYPAVFFAAYQDESVEKRVKIINNEEIPLVVKLGEFPKDHYEVDLDTVQAGKIYELRVKVRPGIPLGRFTERIILHTDRPQKPRLQVAANLFVKPAFYAFPETVDFGAISLETLERQPQLLELLTQTTILTNRFGPVEIRSVETSLPFLQIVQTPASGSSERFRFDIGLSREKLGKGPISGTLRIVSSDPRVPELTIPVKGHVK
jgi:hypothetical protein